MSSRGPAPEVTPLPRAPRMVAGSVWLVGLRLVALLLSFGIGLFVARELGAAEFGRFEGWLAWAALISVACGFGTDKMVVRLTAAYRDRGDWAALRGLLYGVGGGVLAVGAAVALAGIGLAALGVGSAAGVGEPIAIGLVMVPTIVVLRFLQAALQGLDRVLCSQVVDLLVVPLAFAATLLVMRAFRGELNGVDALAGQTVAFVVATLVVATVFVRHRPRELAGVRAEVHLGNWWSQSWPLLVLAFLQIGVARLDIVVFGMVGDDADLGHYAAARRIAAPIVAILLAVNAAAAPVVARLHARGDREGLQRLVTPMARWTTLAAACMGIVVILLGPIVLSWFGRDFVAASDGLRILVLGQVLNSACGSVVLLLIMTGHTRSAFPGLLVATLVQTVLAAALIPDHGVVGAAWASAAGAVTWNVLLALAVVTRLGVDPSVLGRREPAPATAGRLSGR